MRPAIATKFLLLCGALLWALAAQAEEAGRVTHVSGPLFAVKVDGARRVLSSNSVVETGDTLVTEDKTYAQVKFNDQAVVTLRPGTQFKIEAFTFQQAAPEKDNAVFGLFKGALRTISGLVGKRGNQDAYRMQTPTATIGIRGTRFLVAIQEVGGDSGQAQAAENDALFAELASHPLRFAAAEPATMIDVAPAGGLSPLMLAQAPGGGPSVPNVVTILHVEEGLAQIQSRPSLPSIPGIPVPPPPPPVVVSVNQVASASLGQAPVFLPAPPPAVQTFQPPPAFSAPPPGSTPPGGAGGASTQQQSSSSASSSSSSSSKQQEGCVVR